MDLIEHVLLVSEYLEGTGKQVPGRSQGWLLLGTQIVVVVVLLLLLCFCCCCCVVVVFVVVEHTCIFIYSCKEQVVPIVIARGSSFSSTI